MLRTLVVKDWNFCSLVKKKRKKEREFVLLELWKKTTTEVHANSAFTFFGPKAESCDTLRQVWEQPIKTQADKCRPGRHSKVHCCSCSSATLDRTAAVRVSTLHGGPTKPRWNERVNSPSNGGGKTGTQTTLRQLQVAGCSLSGSRLTLGIKSDKSQTNEWLTQSACACVRECVCVRTCVCVSFCHTYSVLICYTVSSDYY